jgi:hypothetical protein
MPPIDELKQLIVSELKLVNVPAAEADQLVAEVSEHLFNALMLTIIEKLPDDAAREKFTHMAEAGDTAALKAYARSQIENFDELMATETRKEIAALKS